MNQILVPNALTIHCKKVEASTTGKNHKFQVFNGKPQLISKSPLPTPLKIGNVIDNEEKFVQGNVTDDGYFVVPVDGQYLFSAYASVCGDNIGNFRAIELICENGDDVYIFAAAQHGYPTTQCPPIPLNLSVTSTQILTKGSKVYVSANHDSDNPLYYRLINFSGCMLL